MPVSGRPSGPKKRIIVLNTIEIIIEVATLVGIFFVVRSLARIEDDLRSTREQQRLNEEKV